MAQRPRGRALSGSGTELVRTVRDLLDTAGIPFMVVGSFASMFYGEPRTTHDLDIVIDPTPQTLEALLSSVDTERFYVDPDVARDAFRRRSMFNIIEMTTAWKVDLIIRKARAFSIEELRRRTSVPVLEVETPTATAEDTIISKLEWAKAGSSERQLRDVAGILRVRAAQLDTSYIERWVEELELREQWNAALAIAAS